jgi:hypothetical protein
MKNELALEQALLRRLFLEEASTLAFVNYGCDLDRLDPAELEWYADRVTEANMEELAEDLAAAAWQAY